MSESEVGGGSVGGVVRGLGAWAIKLLRRTVRFKVACVPNTRSDLSGHSGVENRNPATRSLNRDSGLQLAAHGECFVGFPGVD